MLVSVPQLDATIAITVGTLALTAPQVTGLIALKALALGKGKSVIAKIKTLIIKTIYSGFLIGRLLSRRGKRSTERLNIVEEIETDIVSQIASNEVRNANLWRFQACPYRVYFLHVDADEREYTIQ